MEKIAEQLTTSYVKRPEFAKFVGEVRVNRNEVLNITRGIARLLFPGYFGPSPNSGTLLSDTTAEIADLHNRLIEQIVSGCKTCDHPCGLVAGAVTDKFFEQLPQLREQLLDDADAFLEGDPAAVSLEEVVLAYPGFLAITYARLAHSLHLLGVPLIPRIITEYAHSQTGIDIHPGAAIGHHFFMDHGTGIVIGETTIIKNNVKIYQGVTLGGLSTKGGQKLAGVKRHPTIEDEVTIYAGASILGGQTIIGRGSVIGANAFITASVAPGSKISLQ